jgi:hypothetical protein
VNRNHSRKGGCLYHVQHSDKRMMELYHLLKLIDPGEAEPGGVSDSVLP